MPEQAFEIAALKKRVLELLRRHDSYMPLGSVAMQLGVPMYAVQAALDEAHRTREVEYMAAAGWRALSPEPLRPAPLDERQQTMGSVS